jgi:hypothetical protein
MDDLEEMMMMEAIRLSLASEEERRKKEEKDAKKKAKKEEKEQEKQRKKEEKAARKSSLFTMNSNGDGASSTMERSRSNLSSLADEDIASGKGKGIERTSTPPIGITRPDDETPRPYLPSMSLSETSQESLAPSIPIPSSAEPFRRSHLRQMSNASSAASSIGEPAGSYPGSGTPPPGSLEPMFNFQSLAAMIGEEEKADGPSHVEDADDGGRNGRRHGSMEEMRDAEGDIDLDRPSPLSIESQSQSDTSPLQKGKDVEKMTEKYKAPAEAGAEVDASKQAEASRAQDRC